MLAPEEEAPLEVRPLFVKEAAAGVAGVDGRVGLEEGHILPVDVHLPAKGADDAVGDGAPQLPQRVADGHGVFPHRKGIGIPQDSRGEAVGLNPQDGDIGFGIGPQKGCLVAFAVLGAHGDGTCPVHHMVIGDHDAVLREDDPAARPALDILSQEVAAGNGFGADFHHRGGGQRRDFAHREDPAGVPGLDAVRRGLLAIFVLLFGAAHRLVEDGSLLAG